MTQPVEHLAAIAVPVDDGSMRLLDMDHDVYALSVTAAEMLSGFLRDGREATVARLSEAYGVPATRIAADLDGMLAELRGHGLLRGRADAPRRWRHRLIRGGLRLLIALEPLSLRAALILPYAWLCCRLCGWGTTVQAWSTQKPTRPGQGGTQAIESTLARIASRLPGMACKERALTVWALVNDCAIPADLVVGLHLYPLSGHCWCEAGGAVLADFADRCAQYRQVKRYTRNVFLGGEQ